MRSHDRYLIALLIFNIAYLKLIARKETREITEFSQKHCKERERERSVSLARPFNGVFGETLATLGSLKSFAWTVVCFKNIISAGIPLEHLRAQLWHKKSNEPTRFVLAQPPPLCEVQVAHRNRNE